MNARETVRTVRRQLRSQTPAQRVLRIVLGLALLTALVITVLPAWNVVLVAMGVAIIGAVLTVVIPNSIALLIFLVGIMVNWVLRSSGELGALPIALGASLLVVLLCTIGITLAPPDVRLPPAFWRRLALAGVAGLGILAATTGAMYGLAAVGVPGLLPLMVLGLLLVPIMVWVLLRPR